jgi:4-hydroxy-3-polyprenylbenzoate decarboxylase
MKGGRSRKRVDYREVIVAVTGATGAVYASRLLEVLPVRTRLIVSEQGRAVADIELLGGVKELEKKATFVIPNDELGAEISSSSGQPRSMVIIPCSMNTMSKIACGIADNLITRAASVCLKQDWRLAIVPRETPVSLIHIENMGRLKRAGATILPASPGFYHGPRRIEDLVDFVVGKVLEVLGFEKEARSILKGWKGPVVKKR